MPQDGTDLEQLADRLVRVEVGNGCPFHVAAAILKPDRWGRRRVTSGKGRSPEEAALNCLFEAAERHAAVYDDSHVMVVTPARDLADDAVPPQHLLHISDTQYRTRAQWNDAVEGDHHLPAPFDDAQPMGWIKATSLHDARKKFLPAACCFLGYPNALQEGFPVPDSSGLASGRTLGDAVDRALAECVERDAVAIWWYNRLQRPALQVSRDELSVLEPFAAWIARSGRRFWLLDLSHDLATPVVAAVSCDESGSDLSLGFGAAPRAAEAATQAMGELVQFEASKMNFKAPAAGPFPHLISWCRTANINRLPFLRPHGEAAAKAAGQSGDAVAALGKMALDAFVVDLSRAGQSAKTVRVIAPGLRSVWPRYAPGRLYDVPAALGWIERPLHEQELNPVPMLY